MAALREIKKAKDVGRKLRIAREHQGTNLTLLAKQCGMPVMQLVALEAGNHFAFNGSMDQFLNNARNYAFFIGVDLDESNSLSATANPQNLNRESNIPSFLRKKNYAH